MKPVRVTSRGKRLKGLEEFEPAEFVGRMERVERRQKLVWYAMLAGAVSLGAVIPTRNGPITLKLRKMLAQPSDKLGIGMRV